MTLIDSIFNDLQFSAVMGQGFLRKFKSDLHSCPFSYYYICLSFRLQNEGSDK